MKTIGASKPIRLAIVALALSASGYVAVHLWTIGRQRVAAAQESRDTAAVREYLGRIQPQLAGDLRFADVDFLGYRCDDGSHPYIGMRGTVASRRDWDALDTLIRTSNPPLAPSMQMVLIRPPATNFAGFGGTIAPDGRVFFGRGLARQPPVHLAIEHLHTVQLFAPGPRGFGAAYPSSDLLAVLFLAMQTNAVELFSGLVTNGTSEAKLYALCGIRKVAPHQFDAFARAAAKSGAWPKPFSPEETLYVRTGHGCVSGPDSPSRVIEEIKRGAYDRYFGIKPE